MDFVDFRVGRGKKGGPTGLPSFFPTRRGSTVSDKDAGLLASNYVPDNIEIDIIAPDKMHQVLKSLARP